MEAGDSEAQGHNSDDYARLCLKPCLETKMKTRKGEIRKEREGDLWIESTIFQNYP